MAHEAAGARDGGEAGDGGRDDAPRLTRAALGCPQVLSMEGITDEEMAESDSDDEPASKQARTEVAPAAAGGGAETGLRRSERVARRVGVSPTLDAQQEEVVNIMMKLAFPSAGVLPATCTARVLPRIGTALSNIAGDATVFKDVLFFFFTKLVIQVQPDVPDAKALAAELFNTPHAGDGAPPGIEYLRRLNCPTGKWKATTLNFLSVGILNKLWEDIKKESFTGGGDDLPRHKVEYHMDKLVKALYGGDDVEFRRRNAAAHLAYLIGTRPVAVTDGNGKNTTAFYRAFDPLLWKIEESETVESRARAALKGIPPYKSNDGESCKTKDLLGRPKPAHFTAVHLQLARCGLEADCGAAFAATLDPPGFLPLRNAVVRYTPKGEWQLEVTMAKDVKQRFTKRLDIEWTNEYRKVKRFQRPDGTWALEMDTGIQCTIREQVEHSPVFTQCFQFFRVEHGWSEDVKHDPVDFSIQVLRFFAHVLLELVPSQKAAAVVYGVPDAGKSTLIQALTAGWGDQNSGLKSASGLRGSDEAKITVNFLVRYAMTAYRLVYLKEQVGISIDTFREMLGGNTVTVKKIKSDTKGEERRVTAMLLVEVNKPEHVTLGSAMSGLADKVLAIPLTSPGSAFVSVGGDETARKEFFEPLAEEIFLLEMLALVSHPAAERAIADYWRKKKPLPDSSWRPPLLAEVQQAPNVAGGAAAASLFARVRACMKANFDKTVYPPPLELLMEADFIELHDVHELMEANHIDVNKSALILQLREAGFLVQEFHRKVKRLNGSIHKLHVKNAVFVRRRSGAGAEAAAQPEEPADDE